MSKMRFKETVQIDLSEDIISQVVNKKLGSKPTEIKEYGRGFYCYVYGFELAGEKYVFKLDARGLQQKIEKHILAVVHMRGLAAPQVCASGEIIDQDITYAYTIQDQLNGHQLKKIYDEFSVADQQSIMRSIGKWLKSLHSIPTNGFGLVTSISDNILHGQDESWGTFMSHWFSDKCLDQFIGRHFINRKQKVFLQELGVFLNQREITEGRLLHADLHLEHVFANAGKISGVIDFGNALSGDPLYDISATRLSFRRQRKKDWQDLFDIFLEGYGLEVNDEIEKIVKGYELIVCIDWFSNMLKFDLNERADKVGELLRELLSEAS